MSKSLSDTTELLTGIKNWVESNATAKEAQYAETSGQASGAQTIVTATGSGKSLGSASQPVYLSNGAFALCNVMGGSEVTEFSYKSASYSSNEDAFILRFANGLMIQADRFSISGTSEKTLDFPFSGTNQRFVKIPLGIGSISARTSFSCWCESTTAWKARQDSSSAYSCTCIAIGRWK